MKYSLRSLMIVVTLVAVLLGIWTARVNYLRRMAEYHQGMFSELMKRYADENNLSLEEKEDSISIMDERSFMYPDTGIWKEAFLHRRIAKEYLRASRHPWTCVDESLGKSSL
jgi:hypothetical protein